MSDNSRTGRRQFLTTAGIAAAVGCLGSTQLQETENNETWIILWNKHFIDAIQESRDGNFAPTRRGAMLNVAIFDAVNAITAARSEPHYAPYIDLNHTSAPSEASRVAAGTAAAHEVLSRLYSFDFQEPLKESMNRAHDLGGDVNEGEEWGRFIADQIFRSRADDGEYEAEFYQACPNNPSDAGCFRGNWTPDRAFVDPWALRSPNQFRPKGPPPLQSKAYSDAWHEVYKMGANTEERPQREINQAAFWRGAPGSPRPPNMWNIIAQKIVQKESLPLLERAHLFALLSIALADAAIAGTKAKYDYGFWRPQPAIHEGNKDGNSNTFSDPDWAPLSVGNSPEYPSTLAAFAGAGRRVLVEYLNSTEYAFEIGQQITTGLNGDTRGVSRSFESLDEAVTDSIESRLYLGNHFRFSLNDGIAIGDAIGTWVCDNLLQKE